MPLHQLEVAHIIGPIPDWIPVGPVEDLHGWPARKVLGDWSHLHEFDRPPKYIREGPIPHNMVSGFDRSETREPLKQSRPGKAISLLKGFGRGPCAIFFNGSSLKDHALLRIRTPIIGMNRTHFGFPGYDGPQPDYLCLVDSAWFDLPKYAKTALKHHAIVNGSDHRAEIGYRVTRHPRMAPFSFDLERDGYAGPIPATTGHLALQLAVYMGFTDIYCLGWDLGGKHFNDTSASPHFPAAIRYHKRQAPILRDHGIRVTVCGSPNSRVEGFEHSTFEELVRAGWNYLEAS